MTIVSSLRLVHILLILLLLNISIVCANQAETNPCSEDDHECTVNLATPFASESAFPDECRCYPHDGTGGRIAYLISIHSKRTISDAAPLFRSISSPNAIILIHIDMKLGTEEYDSSELKLLIEDQHCRACGANVFIDRRFDVRWGSWSMNDPLQWAFEHLIFNPLFQDKWDVMINLSGDSLPVYTPQKMSQLFDPSDKSSLYGINFVTSSSCMSGLIPTNIREFPQEWHKRKHYDERGEFVLDYVDDKGRAVTGQRIDIHFGSQWVLLTTSAVNYLIHDLHRERSLANALKEALIKKKRLMSDETFIPTLLAAHEDLKHTFPKTLPSGNLEVMPHISSVRYERLDEYMPDIYGNVHEDQYYDVPTESGVEKHKVWGPYFLGVYDLANIRKTGSLFIRKVARGIDHNLYHILPVNNLEDIPLIEWPHEVLIGAKPDWREYKEYVKNTGRVIR